MSTETGFLYHSVICSFAVHVSSDIDFIWACKQQGGFCRRPACPNPATQNGSGHQHWRPPISCRTVLCVRFVPW